MLHNRLRRHFVTPTIGFKNTQKKVPINKAEILQVTESLLKTMKLQLFTVDLWFCSETRIRELNYEYRDVNKSTDVLSFPANDFISPEVFSEDDPTLLFERHLGDLVIAPSYVLSRCQEDEELYRTGNLDLSADAGVSKMMATVFDVQKRIPLLIVHGLLHLTGYDHETEDEWKKMTERETELCALLKLPRD